MFGRPHSSTLPLILSIQEFDDSWDRQLCKSRCGHHHVRANEITKTFTFHSENIAWVRTFKLGMFVPCMYIYLFFHCRFSLVLRESMTLCISKGREKRREASTAMCVYQTVAVSGQAGSQSVVSIFSLLVLEPYYLSSAAAGAVDLSNPSSLAVSQLTAIHSITHIQTHLHVSTIKRHLQYLTQVKCTHMRITYQLLSAANVHTKALSLYILNHHTCFAFSVKHCKKPVLLHCKYI